MQRLLIPNKLYGRNQDINTLLDSFERIGSGHGQVLLIPGSSGIGKTALVQELQMPVRNRNGFFIKGKFDQYQQNIPYFAFRQALAELLRELKSGSTQQRSRLLTDIRGAVGNFGQILVDLVPEFESLLGTQPPLVSISPQEARHRFSEVFRNFLKVICLPEHPLVLFIDDWQWADTASFELLRQMQVGISLRYLLVIASYRDNEVDSSHPLIATIDDLRSHAVPVEVLKIKDITAEDVREMVADALLPTAEDVKKLAQAIYNKTNGNPFFVRSFLNFLHEFNLIWFDEELNCWQWNMDKIDRADLPNTMVELFILKFRQIEDDSRNLFSLAACLGNRFDLKILSIISGWTTEKCLALLFSNQAKDMFLRLKSAQDKSEMEEIFIPRQISFLHDQVQQAAHSLIKPSELSLIRLKIGRLLLNNLLPEQLSERLFDVVSDLNAGYFLVHDIEEQVKIVELNIFAARKAVTATAYRSALQFYRSANLFFERPGFAENLWLNYHELTMSLFMERAECEFLEGDRNEAENCIQQAVTNAKTTLEKAKALNILIVQYTLLARYPEAIAAGRQALNMLGISLPDEGYDKASNDEISLVRRELGSRKISTLIDLPVMSNPEMLMASKILITLGPPCYRSHQHLWSVIVPKVVNLTLHYGNIPQIGYSHTAFGGLLGWVDKDYKTAKQFGELATQLMTKIFQAPTDQSVFYLMIGSSIRHWFKHLRYSTKDYTDAYETGLQSGNLQYAAYAFGHNMYCRFYQGVPLESLILESKRSLEFSQTRLNQWAIDLLEGGLSIFGELSGETHAINGGVIWLEAEFLQRIDDHHNIQVKCIYKVLKTFTLLLLGNYNEALELSDETEPLIYTVGTQGLLPWPEHVFARILILTALYSKADEELQMKWRTDLGPIISNLRIWADNCPENFEHKYLLAAAELARIIGHQVDAIQLYDQSIEAARSGNFIQWEGIANERAYNFWLECGNERLSQVYWQQAYVCYTRWGAVAKINAMEATYRKYMIDDLSSNDNLGRKDGKLGHKIEQAFLDRQVELLRDYAFQMQQTKLQLGLTTQAEELAKAMQHLRAEMAERKQAEEALKESNERFQSLFNNMSEGVALHELVFEDEKPVNYRIVNVNNQFEKNIGLSREQVAGKLGTEAYGTAIPPYFAEYVAVAIRKTPMYFESYFAEMDKHFAISAVPWQENGFATIFSNITERKEAEQEILLKNEELQKLNATKDKFFSIIAHDLRSPFNSIVGFSDLLLEQISEKNYEGIENYAQIIKNSSRQAIKLLMNLMEWSQSQTGRVEFNPEYFELVKVINEVDLLFLEIFGQKEIVFRKILPQSATVYADKNMISTVLRNLFSNAVKFSHPGGTVTISVIVQQNEFTISVSDTGVGMAKTRIDKLFLIDESSSTIGTRNEKGTGLGLILCKEFVDKNGGKIWTESIVGKGSTFYFTLPCKEKSNEENVIQYEIPTPAIEIRMNNLKILIVEDDETSERLLAIQVKKFGKEVLEAVTGVEAVDICRRNPDIDLILMDIQLPVMDGYEATHRIREFNKNVIIIAQTAYGFAGGREKAIGVGCNDYYTKPISKDQLIKMIQENFKNSQ